MSDITADTQCTAFFGKNKVASGSLTDVALKLKATYSLTDARNALIFIDATSQQLDLDLWGKDEDVTKRIERMYGVGALKQTAEGDVQMSDTGFGAGAKPGRPKLGVVAREVTLLPRHWEWLGKQPGGASVALRKLVDEARRVNQDKDKVRQAQDCTYRFMSAMAGNEQGFEEAARALFARNREQFEASTNTWARDIRNHTFKLASEIF